MDDRRGFEGEGTADLVAYAVAALLLFVLGVFLRTIVLNWIVGPLFVVVVVGVLAPRLRRR